MTEYSYHGGFAVAEIMSLSSWEEMRSGTLLLLFPLSGYNSYKSSPDINNQRTLNYEYLLS